jgi:hypothetical protein
VAKSGGVISQQSVVRLQLPVDIVLFELPARLEAVPSSIRSAELIFSPPEFLAGWQFVYQTAAPPRAPSFVS